jgi:RNA polymerase sigma-70 factor (ECF subfamily)
LEPDLEHAETDADIIQEVLDGRVDAFAKLVERYEVRVMKSVGRRIPGQDVAMVSQETFVAAYRSLPRLSDKEKFSSWLFRIAARECCNYWRKRETEGKYRDYGADGETGGEASLKNESQRQEDIEVVRVLLNRLDAEDRLLITFLFFEEMSLSEAADALGWNYVKTKVRYFRAKKKMRAILKELEETP